jgi:hypothetical protein
MAVEARLRGATNSCVEVVPEGQAYLRLKKAKNNQEKGIIWAKYYEL